MKLISLIFIVIYLDCTSTQASYLKEYNRSLKDWRKLKACSYSYVVSFESWTQYREETTIKVVNKKVVRREFKLYEKDENLKDVLSKSWIERRAQVGSHQEGDAARTMEENYRYCRNQILNQDPEENNIDFQVDDNGILKQCTFYFKGCFDDCVVGIRIEKIIFS